MGFPADVLTPGERVAEHLHPNWSTLVPAVLVLFGTAAATGVLTAVVPTGSVRGPLLVAVWAVAAAAVGWWVVRPWWRWRTTHYVLTTDRLLVRTGVLSRQGRDVALGRIVDVAFERTLADRLLGAGTLWVESAGEHGRLRLSDVPHVERVQQLLHRLIEADEHGRTGR